MIFDMKKEAERSVFVARYASYGFNYIPPQQQEILGLSPISGRHTSWAKHGETIGVLKHANLAQAGNELLVSTLAEASNILAPKVTVIHLREEENRVNSRICHQYALCFSPKIGEEPKPVFDYLKSADRGVSVAEDVSHYLSAYMPFNYLSGNADVNDGNIIISYDKKGDKDKPIVYAIDNELSSFYPAHEPNLFQELVWGWFFRKGQPFYIDTKRVQESATRITGLHHGFVASAVETMHRFVTGDRVDKYFYDSDVDILRTRLSHIKKNFVEEKGLKDRIIQHFGYNANFLSPVLG